MRPHRDTERVLAALRTGDTVGVRRGTWSSYGTVLDLDLDGVTVLWPSGGTETFAVHSAHQQDRVSPAELEVLP